MLKIAVHNLCIQRALVLKTFGQLNTSGIHLIMTYIIYHDSEQPDEITYCTEANTVMVIECSVIDQPYQTRVAYYRKRVTISLNAVSKSPNSITWLSTQVS